MLPQVGESKAMFLDLMRLSAEVRAHAGALDEVTAGYRDMPAEGRTDFEQVLEEAGERHMPDGCFLCCWCFKTWSEFDSLKGPQGN